MADQGQDFNFFRDYLFGKMPEGFKGTPGFKGGQLRRLGALGQGFQAIQDTEKLGPAGEQSINDTVTSGTARLQQGAIGRGLSNSTILGSAEEGAQRWGDKAKLALRESIQERINQLRLNMADIFTRGSFGQAPPQGGGFSWGGLAGGALGSFLGPIGTGIGGALGNQFFPPK